nr:squalene/phytoene synthase family protein [Hyphomonas sp. Mor2]
MTSPASDSLSDILTRLDARVRRVDEERWLSSRYASADQRQSLIVLYAFYYELARVRVAVTDQTMGQIRFQWWRDALDELARGDVRQHDVVLALQAETTAEHLKIAALRSMIERFEAAFLANDRRQEPEDLLAIAAAGVCAPEHEGQAVIERIALDWAQLRRGEAVPDLSPRQSIPTPLRPAVAHFRLRHLWTRGQTPSQFSTRLCILMAVFTGKV